jgi:hypothetical protein
MTSNNTVGVTPNTDSVNGILSKSELIQRFGLTIEPSSKVLSVTSGSARWYVQSKDGKEQFSCKETDAPELVKHPYIGRAGFCFPGEYVIRWANKTSEPRERQSKYDVRVGGLGVLFAKSYHVQCKGLGRKRWHSDGPINGKLLIAYLEDQVNNNKAISFTVRASGSLDMIDVSAKSLAYVRSTPKERAANSAPNLSSDKHDLSIVWMYGADKLTWLSLAIDGKEYERDQWSIVMRQLLGDNWDELTKAQFGNTLRYSAHDKRASDNRPGCIYIPQAKGQAERIVDGEDLAGFFSLFPNVGTVTVAKHGETVKLDPEGAQTITPHVETPEEYAIRFKNNGAVVDDEPTPVQSSKMTITDALAFVKSEFPGLTPQEYVTLAKELIS